MKISCQISLIFITFLFYDLINTTKGDSGGDAFPDYQYNTLERTMPIDHKTPDKGTFQLRYLIGDKSYDPASGAPIFFYPGNGEDVTLTANRLGFIWEAAQEFKALVVFCEHRYYGKSLPYGDDTLNDTKNLAYLTVEQALADSVTLINDLKKSIPGTYGVGPEKVGPVITFGCAYAGILAVYLRMKHSDVVQGALTSAANIWNYYGIYNCEGYAKISTQAYRNKNENCPVNIRKTWDVINQMGSNADSRKDLKDIFNLCDEFKDEDEVKLFIQSTQVKLSLKSEADFPFVYGGKVANPLQLFCNYLTDPNLQDRPLLEAFQNGLNSWINSKIGSSVCIDWKSNSSASLDPWTYQRCTEMIYPICTDGVQDMFLPKPYSIEEQKKTCHAVFKVYPKDDFMVREYGGKNLGNASNIIFGNGLNDPWSSGGVLESLSQSLIAIKMPNAAHCADLFAPNPADTEDVKQAREAYKNILNQWITEFNQHN